MIMVEWMPKAEGAQKRIGQMPERKILWLLGSLSRRYAELGGCLGDVITYVPCSDALLDVPAWPILVTDFWVCCV